MERVEDAIGQDIRALRKARRLTLADCAAALGRSVGWLSQIERGLTTPSVQDLGRIAALFGLSISFFFRTAESRPEERGIVVRAADRSAIGSAASGLREELLSPGLNGGFEMIRSVFAAGAKGGGGAKGAAREDGGVVLAGRLLLTIDATRFDLGPGDSFQFRGAAYRWENPGPEVAEVLWIVAPPVY